MIIIRNSNINVVSFESTLWISISKRNILLNLLYNIIYILLFESFSEIAL